MQYCAVLINGELEQTSQRPRNVRHVTDPATQQTDDVRIRHTRSAWRHQCRKVSENFKQYSHRRERRSRTWREEPPTPRPSPRSTRRRPRSSARAWSTSKATTLPRSSAAATVVLTRTTTFPTPFAMKLYLIFYTNLNRPFWKRKCSFLLDKGWRTGGGILYWCDCGWEGIRCGKSAG